MYVRKIIQTAFRECSAITELLRTAVKESGVDEGICVISLPEETAALGITSFWDRRGLEDLMDELDRNVPARVEYENQLSPYDASGRIKAALVGKSVSLLVHQGELVLGSSQGIVILEFDGPGSRTVEINVLERELRLFKHGLKTDYMGMVDITEEIRNDIKDSGIRQGLCHICQLHSTAGLLLCPAEEGGQREIMADVERLIPTRADFKHRETAPDAGGHVKTAITGSQVSLAVENGELMLAEGQSVVFAEYDGPRPRSYCVGVMRG